MPDANGNPTVEEIRADAHAHIDALEAAYPAIVQYENGQLGVDANGGEGVAQAPAEAYLFMYGQPTQDDLEQDFIANGLTNLLDPTFVTAMNFARNHAYSIFLTYFPQG